jgi:pyruvate kinase
MNRHTKIIATLGPASQDKATLVALVKAGMNTARLNCSHGNYEQFKGMVDKLREIESETGKTILTLLDLQGPKIRLGEIAPEGIPVKRGDVLTFWTGKTVNKGRIPIPYAPLTRILKAGQPLLIEDGLIRTKIVSIKGENIRAKVEVGGLLKRHKGVNIPDSALPSSESLSKKDHADLRMGVLKLKVDAVALSFVERAEDILRVRKLIARWTKRPIFLVAKIERPKALKNLREIAAAADGLMVARGDLGIEIPGEQVPVEQRRILAMGRELGKPVIVATQVLESMTDSPLPTRAEMSDAATAVFEQADAFMLSNESAVGKYPVKAVQTLARVAESTEAAINDHQWTQPIALAPTKDWMHDHHMAKEAIELANDIGAKALILGTHHGYTARAALRMRPSLPVFIVTPYEETARLLHLHWGVEKILVHKGPLRSDEVKAFLKKTKTVKGTVVYLGLQGENRSLVVMNV